MKEMRMILGSIVLVVGLACLALAFLSFRKTESATISKAMKQQKKLYYAGDYKSAYAVSEFLVDSLKIDQDELRLNYATIAYLLAKQDSTRNIYQKPDTTNVDVKNFFSYMGTALETTKSLAGAARKGEISSTAYNHMGVIVCKQLSADQPEETVLNEALDYFKNALDKDEKNELARYNYELVRRKLDYPEMIIARVKSLINQRKYRQARRVLEEAVRYDNRVNKNYGDFVNRIDNIIKIDSLSRS
jgi:tetratricopeptide (TPR) repeat protein